MSPNLRKTASRPMGGVVCGRDLRRHADVIKKLLDGDDSESWFGLREALKSTGRFKPTEVGTLEYLRISQGVH